MKAIWNGAVLAESDTTITIGEDVYFPAYSVHREYFVPTDKTEKTELGNATYYTVMVEAAEDINAAWTYENVSAEAIATVGADFTNYVAFAGVEISES